MRIERSNNEIKFTIPDNIVDITDIQSFVDYIKFKEISSKSKGTGSDVDKLSDDINQSWWDKNRSKFE